MENQNEVVDETIVNDDTTNVTEESEIIDPVESTTDLTVDDYNSLKEERDRLEQEKAELERKNKQLYERAKKLKDNTPNAPKEQSGDFLTREEWEVAQLGLSPDDVNDLKLVQAGVQNTSGEKKRLKDLVDHPVFQACRDKRLAEEKKKNASLGASNGAPVKKTVDTSKMTREEHMKFCQE